MIIVAKRAGAQTKPDLHVELPYESRTKSRLRTVTTTGEELGLVLERGTVLRHGDLLQAEDGRIVAVIAAPEEVSTVYSDDPQALTRAAYHLGNRHVALQIAPGWVRYLHDHVLDDMVRGLGLSVTVGHEPFEPEAGAYSTGHHHGHSHEHVHG